MAPAQPEGLENLFQEVLSQREQSAEEKTKKRKSFRTAGIVLKFLEIFGGVVCLCLLRNYDLLYANESLLYLGIVTTGGYVIISGVLLLGILTKEGNIPAQEGFFNLLGAVLYLLTGVLSIDLSLGFGTIFVVFEALCFVIAFFYLVDTWVAWCRNC